MKRALTLATVAVGLGWSALLSAQDDRFLDPDLQTGTRFKQAPETAGETETRVMQKRVARCVFYGNQKKARTLLANSDMYQIDFTAIGQEPDKLFEDFNLGNCIGRVMKQSQYKLQMSMLYSTFRNLLAEEAYLKDHKAPPKLSSAAGRTIERRFGRSILDSRTAPMTELADCIALNGASSAHAFLESEPGSEAESEAVRALTPALAKCLDAKGEVEVQLSQLRQVVADGMWARGHYGSNSNAEAAE